MVSFMKNNEDLLIESYEDSVEIKNTLNMTHLDVKSHDFKSLHDAKNSSQYLNYTNCINVDNPDDIKFLLDVTDKILLFFPWIMIIAGTFSNLISFIVLTRPKLRKSSTFFYLSCLCVIDLSFLYTVCGNFIFFYQFNIDLQLKSLVLCKLYSFLIYFLPQFSAWTCAAVSFDRVVGVIFSIGRHAASAKRWNTPKKACKVMLVIFICLFLLNVQFFFYPNEYVNQNGAIQDINLIYCSPENIPRYKTFYAVWVNIDLSVNVLIPFAIMIGSSIIIIIGVFKSTKGMSNKRNDNIDRQARALSLAALTKASNQMECQMRFIQNTNQNESETTTLTNHQNKTAPKKAKHLKVARKKSVMLTPPTKTLTPGSKAKNVSTMLATNNIVFISLTLPIVVFLSVTPSFSDPNLCDYSKAKLRLIKILCLILMNTNYSINLAIYSFMASQFRIQLISLFNFFFCIKKSDSNQKISNNDKTTYKQPSPERQDVKPN